MANNYVQSSSLLPIPEDKIEAAREIVAKTLERLEEESEWGGVDLRVEVGMEGVWVSGGESIELEQAADLFQTLLNELEIDEPFVFSWAYACSKPRIDEFGGGACALRRGQPAFWVDAYSVAAQHVNGG